jgi:hypothetical protein
MDAARGRVLREAREAGIASLSHFREQHPMTLQGIDEQIERATRKGAFSVSISFGELLNFTGEYASLLAALRSSGYVVRTNGIVLGPNTVMVIEWAGR